MKNTLVVNIFGGPGAGKSILMAHLFAHLKRKSISTEMALEFAKEVVWQQPEARILNNQIFVFGEQHNRIHRLLGKVDVIITDAPIINSILYDPDNNEDFHSLVLTEHNKLNSVNILCERTRPYEGGEGRIQDEAGAIEVDKRIRSILLEEGITFYTTSAAEGSLEKITEIIFKHKD